MSGKHLSAEEFAQAAAKCEAANQERELRNSILRLVDANRTERGEQPQRGQR